MQQRQTGMVVISQDARGVEIRQAAKAGAKQKASLTDQLEDTNDSSSPPRSQEKRMAAIDVAQNASPARIMVDRRVRMARKIPAPVGDVVLNGDITLYRLR